MQRWRGIVWLVVVVGCGGVGGDDDDGPVPPDGVGEAMGEVECGRMFTCCDADELMDELGFGNIDTVEECVQVFAGFAAGFLEPKIEAAIDSGRMVYHPDRMAMCVAVLKGRSCEESAAAMSEDFAGFAGCDDPFEGLVTEGDPCADDMECASDYCVGDSTDFDGNVTEGVCGAKPTVGSECDFGECSDGLYCEFGDTGPACAATKSAGGECFSDDECQTSVCDGEDPVNDIPGTCSGEFRCDGM